MTPVWQFEFSDEFTKALKKLDRPTRAAIKDYLDRVAELEDPRSRGKGMTANLSGYWRYRIGDYRVLAEIQDAKLVIIAVAVGHCSSVYD